MPLKSGRSSKTISNNISELLSNKPGKARNKAIHTLAKKSGISNKEAARKQSIAIALTKARKTKK